MGFDHVMVRRIVGDYQLMLRSFERIGRDVMSPDPRSLIIRSRPVEIACSAVVGHHIRARTARCA
jgi:hypothetical protein